MILWTGYYHKDLYKSKAGRLKTDGDVIKTGGEKETGKVTERWD